MYKSILQFNESGTIRLDNICADFFENPKDVASFVNGVKDEMLRFIVVPLSRPLIKQI